MASLTTIFERLKESGIQYAIVQGFSNAPRMEPKQMSILTTDAERFAKIIGAEKDADGPYLYRVPGIRTQFFLMQKGQGFFPETFETEMLRRAEIHDGVRRTNNTDTMSARLYWMVYRESAWTQDREFRDVVVLHLERTVGCPCPPPEEMMPKHTQVPTTV